MRIVDAHAHLGYDVVFDTQVDEQTLLSIAGRYAINTFVVQPFIPRPYLEETIAIHNRIHRLTLTHPGMFYGMVSICPHFYPTDVEKECQRCIKDLHFKGIKIATTAHGVNPSGKSGLHIFEIAQSLCVPVMVHTGGGSFGDPLLLERPAQAFPSVPIIIAHGGGESGIEMSIRLAERYDNVFIEPSWVNLLSMEKMAARLGAKKLMYSSDMPQNTPAALALFRAVFPRESDLEQVFYKTASQLFHLPD